MDITAFIGVNTEQPSAIKAVEAGVASIDEVLECHHVTGAYTLMLKVKTRNTESLEGLIDRVRSMSGISRTETMVVLSSHTERSRIALVGPDEEVARPARRNSGRSRRR